LIPSTMRTTRSARRDQVLDDRIILQMRDGLPGVWGSA
jgi:hypothetical protein